MYAYRKGSPLFSDSRLEMSSVGPSGFLSPGPVRRFFPSAWSSLGGGVIARTILPDAAMTHMLHHPSLHPNLFVVG